MFIQRVAKDPSLGWHCNESSSTFKINLQLKSDENDESVHDENNESPEKVPDWFTEVLNKYCDINRTCESEWLPYKRLLTQLFLAY